MNFLKNIYLDITGNIIVFFILLIFSLVFLYFFLKNTMPDLSSVKSLFLKILKVISTVLIIFLLFGFTSTVILNTTEKQVAAFVFDNSASMQEGNKSIRGKLDSLFTSSSLISFLRDVNPEYFYFYNKLYKPQEFNIDSLRFNGEGTNIFKTLEEIKKEVKDKNIKQIFLFTDGIYTDGLDPIIAMEGLDIPVNCIGIGDTTRHKDISISNVDYKKINYQGDEINFDVFIRNNGYERGLTSFLNFSFGDENIQRSFRIPESGAETVINIKTTSETVGKLPAVFSIRPLENEFYTKNNNFEAVIDILKKKKNVLILAGYPSFDVKFLKRALAESERFEINEYIYKKGADNYNILSQKVKEPQNYDLVIFNGFPLKNTEPAVINLIINSFKSGNVPVLFISGSDLRLLNISFYRSFLGIDVEKIYSAPVEVFVKDSGLGSRNILPYSRNIFEQMPPINLNDCILNAPGYEVLLEADAVKSKRLHYNPEIPIFLQKNDKGIKTLFLNGFNFWRWKFLNVTDIELNSFYDDLITGICQYLSTAEETKRVVLKTEKEEFFKGEDIYLQGEVYNEFFRRQDDAVFSVYIDNEKDLASVLNPAGETGTFTGKINILREGQHTVNAEAFYKDISIGTDQKVIYIKRLNTEYLNLEMNAKLLKNIASVSGGEFYSISDFENAISGIKPEKQKKSEEFTLNFKRSISVLIIIVLILSIEWFFRKRWGLL